MKALFRYILRKYLHQIYPSWYNNISRNQDHDLPMSLFYLCLQLQNHVTSTLSFQVVLQGQAFTILMSNLVLVDTIRFSNLSTYFWLLHNMGWANILTQLTIRMIIYLSRSGIFVLIIDFTIWCLMLLELPQYVVVHGWSWVELLYWTRATLKSFLNLPSTTCIFPLPLGL